MFKRIINNRTLAANILRKIRATFDKPFVFIFEYFVQRKFPIAAVLKNKKSIKILERDELFLNWFLKSKSTFEAISQEEIMLNYQDMNFYLRLGTADFFIFDEIFIKDTYGLNKIYIDKVNHARSSISESCIRELNSMEEVDVMSLEKLFNDHSITSVDLCKCDVEGAEYEIFLNTPSEIIKKIKMIIMEVHLKIFFQIHYYL